MRKTLPFLAALAVVVLTSGCANIEEEIFPWLQQPDGVCSPRRNSPFHGANGLFDEPGAHYTLGFVRGFDKSLVRTGVGVYEIVTCPIPPYDPVLTDYITPNPVYPDCYAPGLIAGSTFETDTHMGFSGGDVAPFIPGSRFKVFDMH